MKKFQTISIALATFNGEKYLASMLESFSSQTQPVDELIVCDDGSTDNTVKILKDFKASHRSLNVTIIQNQSNLGFTKNFSKAIGLCTGDLIFLADQDDIWEPTKVKVMAGKYARGAFSYLISDMKVMDSDENLKSFTFAEYLENEHLISSRNFMNGCAVMADRKFLLSCLPVPYGKSHDSWFAYCARRLRTRLFLPEPLMRYRIHAGSLTSKKLLHTNVIKLKGSKIKKSDKLNTLVKVDNPFDLILVKILMQLYFLRVKVKWLLG